MNSMMLLKFLLLEAAGFLVIVWAHTHSEWDPTPLKPYFWLPSTLIPRFDISNKGKHPCQIADKAIELGSDYGRLNNYLIELVHMLEIALFSEPQKVLLLSPLYDKLTKWHLNLIEATKSFACVMKWDDEKAKKYPLMMKVVAEEVFFQEQKEYSTFRGEVLAQLFLRPSQQVRNEVETIERKYNLTQGYNVVHFRTLEGSCLMRIKYMFDKTYYPYAVELGRHINEKDICYMSDDYIRWKLERANSAHLPLVISHDDQNPKRLNEIQKAFNAVIIGGDEQRHVVVDMLLMIRANTFIPNVASTLSQNVEHIRRVLHLEDTYPDDWRIINVPGTLPYHPSEFARNGTRTKKSRRRKY